MNKSIAQNGASFALKEHIYKSQIGHFGDTIFVSQPKLTLFVCISDECFVVATFTLVLACVMSALSKASTFHLKFDLFLSGCFFPF